MQVATKLFVIEQQKKQAERLQKVKHIYIYIYITNYMLCESTLIEMLIMKQMIEEEEVRLLRKEMIPRAQLMPFFDRPFFPQR